MANEFSTTHAPGVGDSSREDRRADHDRLTSLESRTRAGRVLGGGPDGNERLTIVTGLLLICLLAVLGVTIVLIGRLLWLHMFLGLLLVGPVVLKLLSTGYRFVRYYTADPDYRRKGPPASALRILGPLVVVSTLAVFATGVALLWLGPSSRQPFGELHKLSFIVWIAVVALHVLGHLREIVAYLRHAGATRREMLGSGFEPAGPERRAASRRLSGSAGRGVSLLLAMGSGGALAIALLPLFGAWTH